MQIGSHSYSNSYFLEVRMDADLESESNPLWLYALVWRNKTQLVT